MDAKVLRKIIIIILSLIVIDVNIFIKVTQLFYIQTSLEK